ncbi:DNA repair protein RecO [bacterium]|nr:DNA repair protein RecO [bacterium]
MSEKLVTKGIVLRATATKEADYILNILTDSLGRIAVVARGARRKGSRIAAGSELLAFSELVLYQRGNWYYLDEASTISLFDGIRQDIELLSLASYFAEMTECVTAEDEPVPEILSLLLNSLYALDTLHWTRGFTVTFNEVKSWGYVPLGEDAFLCQGIANFTTATRNETRENLVEYEMLWIRRNGTWYIQDMSFL